MALSSSVLSLRGLITWLISFLRMKTADVATRKFIITHLRYRNSNKYFQRPDYSQFSCQVMWAMLAWPQLALVRKKGHVLMSNLVWAEHAFVALFLNLLRANWSLRLEAFHSIEVVWESNGEFPWGRRKNQNPELVADYEINKHYPNTGWAEYNRIPQTCTQCEEFLENTYVSFDWKFLKLPIFKILFCKIEVYVGKLKG